MKNQETYGHVVAGDSNDGGKTSAAKKPAIVLGIWASLFFAITFVVNRLMALEGGSWIWSASLRFYWMLPIFLFLVWYKGKLAGLIREMKGHIGEWVLWSTVGFGVFYAALTFAAAYGPSWLVASTWQFTIVAGMLLAPFINTQQPGKGGKLFSSFVFSGIILLGIVVMQVSQAESLTVQGMLVGTVPVLVAAFAYPLGNRKMMQLTKGRLDVYQRILGMLVCSLPFWFLLSGYALFVADTVPGTDQYFQTLIVAVCSGVIATVLFFSATDKVNGDEKTLAAVEATQSTEVLFALAGEIVLLGSPLPDIYSLAGIVLVILGMLLHNLWEK
jgi:drug/metabolite transporter (DMT)-like permease